MSEKIKTVIRTIPHPNPQQVIDVFARLVLKHILERERAEASIKCAQ